MKYIIVLGDGMADEPIGKLGGRTPFAGGRYSGYGLVGSSWSLWFVEDSPRWLSPR